MPSLTRRIERLEQAAQLDAKVRSRFDPRCICYPDGCTPWVGFPILDMIAFLVKCPLHGDRFSMRDLKPYIYAPPWMREKIYRLILNRSPSYYVFSNSPRRVSEQYRKAYHASFPPDLWPGQEEQEEAEYGPRTFLRLKDGTRFQVEKLHFWKRSEDSGEKPSAQGREKDEAGDWVWQVETLRIAGRQLAERGLSVDASFLSSLCTEKPDGKRVK